MHLVAPDTIDHFNFDNVEYKRDEKGRFEIMHPDHIAKAQRHGAVPYVPGEAVVIPAKNEAAPIPDEHGNLERIAAMEQDARLAAEASAQSDAEKDAEIAELKALLAETQAGKDAALQALEDAGATVTAEEDADDADDTSSDTGGPADEAADDPEAAARAEQMQKIEEELAKDPKFDAMDRDQKVEWLAKVGVSVSPAISKVKAQDVIDETISDYEADKAAASSE